MAEIIDGGQISKTKLLFKAISDRWVYFFFNEMGGSDTKPGEGNVDVVFFSGKDNPMLIPLISNDQGVNGVVYTTLELAIESVEFNCKIGKMKGKDAFKMFYQTEQVDSVYIQSGHGFIHPSRQEFARLAGQEL